MTETTVSYVLRNCDETKGKIVRQEGDLKAIRLTKRIREPCGKRRKYECLILMHKDKKVGIIVHFPDSDVQLFVFKKRSQ